LTFYKQGEFVWCMFPFREQPGKPGPVPHIIYVHRTLVGPDGRPFGLVAYTTTTAEQGRRVGSIAVPEDQSRRMGMNKPFVIVTRRQAVIPYHVSFFHRAKEADRGVAGQASKRLIDQVTEEINRSLLPGQEVERVVVPAPKPSKKDDWIR
jgi:hypothetical protein